MLTLSMEFIEKEVFDTIENNEEIKKVRDKFSAEIAKLPKDTELTIEELANRIETLSAEIAYSKGFGDGIRFIVNAMVGKNVLEL